jgi:hypothetical protein
MAAAPARAPKGKAAKGGDAIGIGRAALSERQRELRELAERARALPPLGPGVAKARA